MQCELIQFQNQNLGFIEEFLGRQLACLPQLVTIGNFLGNLLKDDFVLFVQVTVVEAAEQKLSWSVDGSAQHKVGEEQVVVVHVQLVVTVRGHSVVALFGQFP